MSVDSSRRRLMGGLGATVVAASAATPATARASSVLPAATTAIQGAHQADAVVIGAGYSGLACALALRDAGQNVMLLEARQRVGGRCKNMALPAPFQSYVVEAGAEFIGPTQTRMYELVQAYGLQTFPAYDQGLQVSYLGGRRRTYSGVLPWTSLLSTGETGLALLKLEAMATQVPIDAPWTASKAAEWDSETVQTWIQRNLLTRSGQQQIRLAVLALLSTEPADISMLFLLTYIRRGGGLTLLLSTSGGAQQDRIVGGSQAIALAMAQDLGGVLTLGAEVRQVNQDAQGVDVVGDSFTVRAKHVVVAMAPAMAGHIRFNPFDAPMQQRQQLAQRVPMGAAWKVHCVYDRPFWREAGLSAQCISDAFLPKITFDNTPPEPGAPGVIMAFIDGQDARDAGMLTQQARRANVLQALGVYFGPQATQPLAYDEMNWQSEVFSEGGPTGVFPPGVLTGFGPALRTPAGRVHWAGTETASAWMGYMEGAVRSGERAAQEILNA